MSIQEYNDSMGEPWAQVICDCMTQLQAFLHPREIKLSILQKIQ